MLANRIIFVCTVVLAMVYLYGATRIPSLDIGDPLGPKAFPMLLGIGLLIAAGMLALEMWRDKAKNSPEVDQPAPFEPRVIMVLGGVAVWTGAYYLTFIPLGYVGATAIYLFGLMAYFHPRKWVPNVATAVLFPLVTFFLFAKLEVSLPKGILPF